MSTIRPCRDDEREMISRIINAAAEAYRSFIPDDCWHDPYMALDEPCVHAAATTPVQRLGVVFARVTQPCQPSPVPPPDRPAHPVC